MRFRLHYSGQTDFDGIHGPRVHVIGLPLSRETVEDIRGGKGLAEKIDLVYEVPNSRPITAIFCVEFPKAAVSVMARIFRATGADLRWLGNQVRIDIRHEERRNPLYGLMREQCTVTCPRTGESRSGPDACIECSDGDYAVRICC